MVEGEVAEVEVAMGPLSAVALAWAELLVHGSTVNQGFILFVSHKIRHTFVKVELQVRIESRGVRIESRGVCIARCGR